VGGVRATLGGALPIARLREVHRAVALRLREEALSDG
jgi:hypothetical protein